MPQERKSCVISGSFRKFYDEIIRTMDIFEKAGISVLSPAKSRIRTRGEFVLLESDGTDNVKELESAHMGAIRKADFLYVVNPEGYVGNSVMLEMGYAVALGKPIFSLERINDVTLREFVTDIISPKGLCRRVKSRKQDELTLVDSPTLSDFQRYVEKMVAMRGFDKETVSDIMILLIEEVGELARAVRKTKGLKMSDSTRVAKVEEELADCFIYILDAANKFGIDLEKAFRKKEKQNKRRVWK